MSVVRIVGSFTLLAVVSAAAWGQTQPQPQPANPLVRRLQSLRNSLLGGGDRQPPTVQSEPAPPRQQQRPARTQTPASPQRQGSQPSQYQQQDAAPAAERYRISVGPESARESGDAPAVRSGGSPTTTSQRRSAGGTARAAGSGRLSPQTAEQLRGRLEALRAGRDVEPETLTANRERFFVETNPSPAPEAKAKAEEPTESLRDKPLDEIINDAIEQEFRRAETRQTTPRVVENTHAAPSEPVVESTPANQPTATAASRRTTSVPEESPWAGLEVGDADASSNPVRRPSERRGSVLAARRMPTLDVAVLGPDTIKVGRPADYEIVVGNVGAVDAAEVEVTVDLPAWTDFIDAGSGPVQPTVSRGDDGQARTLTWTLTSLGADQERRFSLRLTPRESRPFDLAVRCTCSPESAQTVVEVQEPKLHLDIVGPTEINFGERRTYRLQLSNPGTGDAEDVNLAVYVGQGVEQSATETIARLAAGSTRVLELELEAREAGTIAVRAEAIAAGGAKAEATESVLVRRATLEVAAVGPKYLYTRSPAVYRVRVRNTGNAEAERVRISAMLPGGTEYETCSKGGEFDSERGVVVWTLPRMAPGAETIVDVRCVLNADGENRLRVGVIADRDVTAVASAATKVAGLADLKLEVRDPAGAAPVGGEMVYRITVQNRGTEAAQGVSIAAYFSEGVAPLRVEGAAAEVFAEDGAVEVKSLGTVAAGETREIRVVAQASKPGAHTFRVELECPELEIRLSEDETTRFYSEESVAGQFEDEKTR